MYILTCCTEKSTPPRNILVKNKYADSVEIIFAKYLELCLAHVKPAIRFEMEWKQKREGEGEREEGWEKRKRKEKERKEERRKKQKGSKSILETENKFWLDSTHTGMTLKYFTKQYTNKHKLALIKRITTQNTE